MIDQHNSLAEKFLKKGFWLYLFSFIIAPIWYIIKIIISGELTVSEVGILYGIISLITMISAYNDLWMSESINYFVPKFITEKKYDKVKTILVYAFLAQIITWITIAALFFFWADWLAINYFKSEQASSVLKIFAFYFLGINILQILLMFFISIQNTFIQKLVELVRMIFSLLFIIIFVIFWYTAIVDFSYAWIIGLYIWVLFSIGIFYLKYFNQYFKNEKILWEKTLFTEIFKYGLLVFMWAQVGVLLSQIDMQMIIYILWTTDAWYYTNYLSIIWIPFLIITPIFSLLFPVFSELHSKKEYDKISTIREVFTNNFIIIWIFSNCFLFTFSIPITYVLFGEKFITSWFILKWSVLFLVFNFLLQINFSLLSWIGRVKERLKILMYWLGFNILTNILLINYFWVYWAALATWIWWLFIWWLSEYLLKSKYKISFFLKVIIRNILIFWWISLVLFLYFWNFSYFIQNFTRVETLWILTWCISIYIVIFIIINYTLFKWFISEMKKLKRW